MEAWRRKQVEDALVRPGVKTGEATADCVLAYLGTSRTVFSRLAVLGCYHQTLTHTACFTLQVHNEAEIKRLLPIAKRHGVPVTFRAAGTSLSGQAITDSVLLKLSHTGKNFRNYTIHVSPFRRCGRWGSHTRLAVWVWVAWARGRMPAAV